MPSPPVQTDRAAALALLLNDHERAMLLQFPRLSNQERAVFTFLGRGLRLKAVASELALSGKTVETVMKRIRTKLTVPDRRPPDLADVVLVATLWLRAGGEWESGFS